MKKLAIMAALAVASFTAAAATEVELHGGRNFGVDDNFSGISIGHREGIHALTLGYDHASKWNRWSLTGAREIGKIGNTAFDLKLGVAHVDPDTGKSGTAGIIGFGASLPIAPHTALVADIGYQKGQKKIKAFDGAVASAGLKFTF